MIKWVFVQPIFIVFFFVRLYNYKADFFISVILNLNTHAPEVFLHQ